MNIKLFPIVLGLFVSFFSQPAAGEDFYVKKKYRDWSIYSSASNECFLASRANGTSSYLNSREILGKNRQNSFIYLSVNKNSNTYSMSYFSDYPLKNTDAGSMSIDNKKMLGLQVLNSIEASGNKHAVVAGLVKEDVSFLKSGSRLTIKLVGIDNSMLVDQFSLMGFTRSLNYLLSVCN